MTQARNSVSDTSTCRTKVYEEGIMVPVIAYDNKAHYEFFTWDVIFDCMLRGFTKERIAASIRALNPESFIKAVELRIRSNVR